MLRRLHMAKSSWLLTGLVSPRPEARAVLRLLRDHGRDRPRGPCAVHAYVALPRPTPGHRGRHAGGNIMNASANAVGPRGEEGEVERAGAAAGNGDGVVLACSGLSDEGGVRGRVVIT